MENPTPSNNIIQPNVGPYQPLPYDIQTANLTPPTPIYIQSNGLLYPNHGIIVIQQNPSNVKRSNYKHILIWSIFNTLCCIWPLGLIALIASIITMRMIRRGNEEKARHGRIIALVINAISTIGGIVLVIVLAIIYSKNKSD